MHPKTKPCETPPQPEVAHSTVAKVIAQDKLFAHSGQHFVYLGEDGASAIKLTDCAASIAVLRSLNERPCEGLPMVTTDFGTCAKWNERKLHGFRTALYHEISERGGGATFFERLEVLKTIKVHTDRIAKRHAIESAGFLRQYYIELCNDLSNDPKIQDRRLAACFAFLGDVLANDCNASEDWALDTGNTQNWLEDDQGRLVLVDPVASNPNDG